MTQTSERRLTLAAIWLVLPVVGAIVAATLEPIPPHDYWWHVAMGRLVGAGQLPDSNLFLYTLPADLAFVNQPWLGQWMMWFAYDLLGHTGTVLLRNMFLGLAFAVIVATAWRRSGDARAAGALGLLAAIVAYPVMTVRTRMFAFVPFTLVMWACVGVADRRLSRRWLAIVPVLTVFWANVHGSFVLAIAIVGAVGLGVVVEPLLRREPLDRQELATWSAVLIATALAPALSPLGFGVYGYVAQLTMESTVAHSVTEWLPPDIAEATGKIFAGAVAMALVVLALRRREVRVGDALLFAGTLALAVGAIRSIFWWAAVMPVVMAPHVAAFLPVSDDESSSRESSLVFVMLVAVLAVSVVVQPGLGREAIGELTASGQARHSGEGAWVLNHENALAAVQRIREDQRSRVFHDQVLGGLLELRLTRADRPTRVAYVDQRMEFVPEEVWRRYFALSRAAPNWDRELRRLGVDTLLLSPQSQWPLLQAALESPDWRLVAVDQSHALLYRRGSLDRAEDPPK